MSNFSIIQKARDILKSPALIYCSPNNTSNPLNQIEKSNNRPFQKLSSSLIKSGLMAAALCGSLMVSQDVLAKGRSHVQNNLFNTVYAKTLSNEGNHQITVDMQIMKNGKRAGLKRAYQAETDNTEVIRTPDSIQLVNKLNGNSITIPKDDISQRRCVITNAGIDSRFNSSTEISRITNSDADIFSLTKENIKQIYQSKYWNTSLAKTNPNIAYIAFDIGVNQGVDIRNDMLATVAHDLANYEINVKVGFSKADAAVISGIALAHPGAVEYELGLLAKTRYDTIDDSPQNRQNKNGWLNRANSYFKLAGDQGRIEYEQLIANAQMGREAMDAQQEINRTTIDPMIVNPMSTDKSSMNKNEMGDGFIKDEVKNNQLLDLTGQSELHFTNSDKRDHREPLRVSVSSENRIEVDKDDMIESLRAISY